MTVYRRVKRCSTDVAWHKRMWHKPMLLIDYALVPVTQTEKHSDFPTEGIYRNKET